MTVKNKYPLPRISDLLSRIGKSKYFSTLDVRWGYMNILIKPKDQWKAAFKTKYGLYEPNVMLFGLCNSPATFQAFMDDIYRELVATSKLLIYMDDLFVHTETEKEHWDILRQVLQIAQKHDLYFKLKKTKINQSTVPYLGVMVSEGQIAMDQSKVKAIMEWPYPTKVKEVQQFVGFCNYYHGYIKDFSRIAKPLYALTQKGIQWLWTNKEQEAWDNLKAAFHKADFLGIPDPEKPYQLEPNGSGFATGGVLMQKNSKDKWHPIAFLSKGMVPAERNYDIYDRELLALIRCLEEWRYLLLGCSYPIEVFSDHQNLTWFKHPQNLNRRQARWMTYI